MRDKFLILCKEIKNFFWFIVKAYTNLLKFLMFSCLLPNIISELRKFFLFES